MTWTTFALLLLLGVGVGGFGTLVGAGGGFILTPVLLVLYPRDSAETISAISLAVVFFNAGSGSLAYARLRRIDYRSGIPFALATLPGAVAGSLVVAVAPRRVFDILMAALLGGLAIWLFVVGGKPHTHRSAHKGAARKITDAAGETYVYNVQVGRGVALSVGVGFVSSFLGIGGGIIHVPLLVNALGFPVHLATATSHFVLAAMSFVGSVTHVLAGSFRSGGAGRTIALAIGVIAGAQAGARLSERVKGHVIQRLLAVALIGLAVRLVVAAI
jgi:uncharacterized protein